MCSVKGETIKTNSCPASSGQSALDGKGAPPHPMFDCYGNRVVQENAITFVSC